MRAEASGQYHVGGREAHEHHLAREEIAEVDADILERVAGLLVRQNDVEADRGRPAGVRAAIDGFHQSGPAAGDHREARIGQKARDVLGLLVVRVTGRDARAAEEAYRRTNAAQALGRDGKLCHNAQNTPRFLPVGREIRQRVDQLGNLARLIHA